VGWEPRCHVRSYIFAALAFLRVEISFPERPFRDMGSVGDWDGVGAI
jgi:hypothetical protein